MKVNLIAVFKESIELVSLELDDTVVIIKRLKNGIENKAEIKLKLNSDKEAEIIYNKKLNEYFNDGYTTIELPFIDDILNFPTTFKTKTKE